MLPGTKVSNWVLGFGASTSNGMSDASSRFETFARSKMTDYFVPALFRGL